MGASFRAYPALGVAPFLDHRLTSMFSVGFSPEVTLSVVPNRNDYVVGTQMPEATILFSTFFYHDKRKL
jgi:hypothetical protein